jgi:hypothetical protein
MNNAGIGAESSANRQDAPLTVLKHGFRHPRSGHKGTSADHGRNGPPEIKERACTWDRAADR